MTTIPNRLAGIKFINPSDAAELSPEDEAILTALDAPPPYFKQGVLFDHLWAAMWPPSKHLTGLEHRNTKSGNPFQCLSYYADDPDLHAVCTAQDDTHVAMIGAPFVFQLVKLSERIGHILALRSRNPNTDIESAIERDDSLRDLLNGDVNVSEDEAEAIATTWPSAGKDRGEVPLGADALFHDLIRLIWMHEWAHALCGHVRYVFRDLEQLRLFEFSAERTSDDVVAGVGAPRNEVLQALESHADEFAARYCVLQILRGYDPIGRMAGPTVNLVDRLLIFNVASCIFAMVWSLAEQKHHPGISFYPPRQDLTSDAPDPMFAPYKTSHPPAALRYYRLRGFQRTLAYDATEYGKPGTLSSPVDVQSYRFVRVLGRADARFHELIVSTPFAIPTPTIKRLEAYEQHLLEVLERVSPYLEELGYPPTRDPHDDDAEESAATPAEPAVAPGNTDEADCGATRELARRVPEGKLPDQRLSSEQFGELFGLAEQGYTSQNFSDARAILHSLIVLDRQSTPAWSLLGRVEHAAGLLEDARAAFAFALDLEPNNAVLANELARVDQALRKGS